MESLALIPGVLCDRRLWSDQIEALSGSAEIMVADVTRQTTLSEMAKDVLAAAHEVLAREIPGAKLIMIEDSGHFTTLEQPNQVTLALQEWLAARVPSAETDSNRK